jgi:HTH-type transcriptional regulator, competence development regulator
MTGTFGKLILKARRDKQYSQRELAKLIGINFTYLSKLENDRTDYPPSKEIIQSLAKYLDLKEEKLTQLAGRIDSEDWEILKDLIKQYPEIPALLRRMRNKPEFAKKIFSQLRR